MSVKKEYNFRPGILRSKSGSLKENPFIIQIYGDDKDDSIKLEGLKILVYEAGNYELPIHTLIYKTNITIEYKKTNTQNDVLNNKNSEEQNNNTNKNNKGPKPNNKDANKILNNSDLAHNSSNVNNFGEWDEVCKKVEQQILSIKANPIKDKPVYFRQIEMILKELEKCNNIKPELSIFADVIKEYNDYIENLDNGEDNRLLVNNNNKGEEKSELLGNNNLNNNVKSNNTANREEQMRHQNLIQIQVQDENILSENENNGFNTDVNIGLKDNIVNQLRNDYNNEKNITNNNKIEPFHGNMIYSLF